MKKVTLMMCVVMTLLASCATMKYETYNISDVTALPKAQHGGYQGMAIHDDYLVSLQNQGWCTIYRLPDMKVVTPLFKLGSFYGRNHANVGSFGVERVEKGDVFPLLYVSHCHRKNRNNWKDACYVEHLNLKGSSEWVQTIILDDTEKLFGYALQWTVDAKRKRLIGFGNTLQGDDANNRFRIIVFPLPKLSEGKEVHLKPADALENYVLQDYTWDYPARIIGQGACVYGDMLVMPTGFGNEKWPSVLFVWDMKHKRMVRKIDLAQEVKAEMEDIDFYKGEAYVQTNGRGLIKFAFGK